MGRVYLKILGIIILGFLLGRSCYGQYSETLSTDRPGQAFTPSTVGKGAFQFETGVAYLGSRASNTNFRTNSGGFTTFFKHGLSQKFELNYGFTVLNRALRVDSIDQNDTGVQGMNLGTRFNIKSGEGNQPSFGFLFTLFLNNYAHRAFKTDHVAPLFLFLYSQSLGEVVSLSGNLGMSWNGDTPQSQTNYVLNLGFSLTDNLSAFVENYGWLVDGDFSTNLDGGFSYLINDNLQVDLSGGYGKNDGFADFFVATGISIRSAR